MTDSARDFALALTTVILLGCTKAPITSTPNAPTPATPTGEATEVEIPEASDVAVVGEASGIESKVTKVTVYSDRARLTREATVEIGEESTVLAFRGLPGWVDDGSVRVATSAGRILDVRVDRSFLAHATDKNWKLAEARHKKLEGQLAALSDELAVLAAEKTQIESIKAFSLEKITQDTTIGTISVQSYGDVVKFISDSLRKTAAQRREVASKIEALAPELVASQRTLDEMQSLMKLEETAVLVSMKAPAKISATLTVTYMMPGVTWEPMHELRVSTASAQTVEVLSFAVVTQTSGEDWGEAELSFSTQSAVKAVKIPELDALTLGDTQTTRQRITAQVSSFTRAQQAFYGQSALWNKVHRDSTSDSIEFDESYQRNIQSMTTVQSKTVRLFEGLENRGTTSHFRANAAPSVRGDGHPVRMRIGYSTLKSDQKIVAAPEQSLNAALTMAMTNETGQALLPGRVALYQDGAFLGMTDIDFIADKEAFSTFLSVADHIKLSRTLDRKRSSIVRKRRHSMQLSFVVTVENLSERATSLALADRIPVSENRDIRVEDVRIEPAAKPDSKGLLRWDLTLRPKEKREFRVSYRIDYPPELILETKRRRAADPAPAAPSPSERKIEDDLIDFEDQL